MEEAVVFAVCGQLLHFRADGPVHHGVGGGAQAFVEIHIGFVDAVQFLAQNLLEGFRSLSVPFHRRFDKFINLCGDDFLGQGDDVGL